MRKPNFPTLLRSELAQLRGSKETTDTCFVRWYLGVRLGIDGTRLFHTDGPRDGGIDAVRYPAPGERKVVLALQTRVYFKAG
jgi:hypothetical protein